MYVPVALNRDYINESINKDNELYALQQGNLQDVKLINLHSGPAGMYYPLLNKLMSNFPDRPVYLFSYDWRDSNVETRDKLYNFINEITDNHKTKVDIIAHSMGGLVTSHYAQKYDDTVDKIITIGTPYEGASTVYNSLELNRVIGNFEDSLATALLGVKTSLLLDTNGLSELLPSARFYNKYPIQVVENNDEYQNLKKNRKNYISNLKTNHLDYGKFIPATKQSGATSDLGQDEVDQFMINRIGLDRHTAFINNSSMYRENGQRDGNINLLNRDNTTFLVSRGYETDVSTVVAKDEEGYKIVDTVSSLEGDTLVPLYSATMGIELDDMPQEIRDKFIIVNGNHVTMLTRPKNLNKLVEILSE